MDSTVTVIGKQRPLHPIAGDELFYIAQEAIRNARTHSRASRLRVELRFNRDFTVRVKDNGIGIDLSSIKEGKPGHFGLRGIRQNPIS
jgi:signal transduction histidine kinase